MLFYGKIKCIIQSVYITEVLPLVEFYIADEISDKEAVQLLDLEPLKKEKQKTDGWKQDNNDSIFVMLCGVMMSYLKVLSEVCHDVPVTRVLAL